MLLSALVRPRHAGKLSPKNPRAFIEDLTRPQKKILGELQELVAHQQSNLLWYHRAGTKLLELRETLDKREPGWRQQLAGALGISPSGLTKIRKFAADFSQRQAERLDEIGANWGMVIVIQHARTGDRMKLLEEAVAKRWGVADLQAAVRQRFGVRNPGGRPLRKPRSPTKGLVQLQTLGDKWLRYYREVWAGGEEPFQDQLPDLSPKDRQRLLALVPGVKSTMQEIQRSALAVDKFLGELERKARRS